MTDIESLSASLVREFLSRKGLKRSLRVLDDEFPREENSIRNRVLLAKELKIEKLLRLNKELECPMRTMIEVMAKFFVNEKHLRRSDHSERKDRHGGKPLSTTGNDSKSDTCLSIDQQSDAALRSSERLHKPKSRRPPDKNAAHGSETSTWDTEFSSLLGPATSLENLGLNENKQSASWSRSTSRPVAEGSLVTKTKSSGVQSTMEKSRKQKSRRSINVNPNGDLFSSGDFELESRNRSERPTILHENNIKEKRDTFAAEKQKSVSVRTEEPRHKDVKRNKTSLKSSSDILVFDEIDSEFSDDNDDIKIGQPTNNLLSKLHESATPITLEAATSLKTLVFGSASKSFNSEWRSQSFSFCDLPDLEYGIVQIKGGPCGVLAAMQATVLKFLLFINDKQTAHLRRPPNPSIRERTNALIDSIAEILWHAGRKRNASIVLCSIKEKFIGGARYRSDGITETLMIYKFTKFDNLRVFISQNISQFEGESNSGCILFLYSLVFSRTIQRILEDMDEQNGSLIGAHGYCTQELVNLCLSGKATSNVFDGNMELDSGGETKSLLKGIEKQCDVGLLSLFEHYESCKVGDYYKSPKYPIWVVCSESHFSTLFSTNDRLIQDRKQQGHFDLYYYDGLARQDEEIRLTIDITRGISEQDSDDLIPPLEHCIRTKWKNAIVNWNGTEPIL